MHELDKYNMIVWCFKENTNARKFYENLGGTVVEEKTVIIGDDAYEEVCYYYDLDTLIEF